MAEAEFRIDLRRAEYDTPKCGRLTVYTHGNRRSLEVAILTVHDVGSNHLHYVDFLKHPDMVQIAKRFLWVHVLLPGHGVNDKELPSDYKYPSLQCVADDLIHVIDAMGVKHVVVFGEGAGANILARFAMQHESRVYGAFLIHLVGTTESVFSKANFRMSLGSKGNALKGWNPAIEEFLVKHRFGKFKDSAQSSMKEYTEAYKTFLNTLNNKNCMDYISAYSSRNSIKEKIGELQCPVIFITCNKSVYNNSVVELHYTMQRCFDKDPTRKLKTELIQFDGIGNVLVEKPSKVAECFQYFLQGLGLGSSLINRRISSTSSSQSNPPPKDPRIRSLSMADYDKPRGLTYYSGSAAQPDTPERKQPD